MRTVRAPCAGTRDATVFEFERDERRPLSAIILFDGSFLARYGRDFGVVAKWSYCGGSFRCWSFWTAPSGA